MKINIFIMYTIITIALQPQPPQTPLLSNYHNKYLHKNIDDNVTEYMMKMIIVTILTILILIIIMR